MYCANDLVVYDDYVYWQPEYTYIDIGGPEEVKAMIADLQAALVKMGEKEGV